MQYREEHLLKTIESAKEAFFQEESTSPLPLWEFVCQQSHYIHKRWWCLQGGFLLFLLWSLSHEYVDLRRGLGVAAPLFTVLALPELWKNRSCNAIEVEAASFYSLRQIYAARMALFALVDLMLISGFLTGLCLTVQVALWELTVQFLLPFAVSCCICLKCLYTPSIGSESYSLLLCGIWTLLWDQIVRHDAIYNAITLPVWCALLALSLMLLGWCILRGQGQWETIWEVRPIWN